MKPKLKPPKNACDAMVLAAFLDAAMAAAISGRTTARRSVRCVDHSSTRGALEYWEHAVSVIRWMRSFVTPVLYQTGSAAHVRADKLQRSANDGRPGENQLPIAAG